MRIDQAWRAILARYGQKVTLYPAGEGQGVEARALLQPVLSRGEDQKVPSPLGLRREDRFLYLGPAHLPLEDGGTVEWNGGQYAVESTHLVGPEAGMHRWAMLRPRDKEADA